MDGFQPISIFHLPLLKNNFKLNENLLIVGNTVYISNDKLTEFDKNFLLINFEISQNVSRYFSDLAEEKPQSNFARYFNYIINLHTLISQTNNIIFQKNPLKEDIFLEFYKIFLIYFYINNIRRDFISNNNLVNYINYYFLSYNYSCLLNLNLNKNINFNVSLLLLLSLTKENEFYIKIKSNEINLENVLLAINISIALVFWNKKYKHQIELSKNLTEFVQKSNEYSLDYREENFWSFLENFFEQIEKIFGLNKKYKLLFIYVYNNIPEQTIYRELFNFVNFQEHIYIYFQYYEKSIYSKLLFLLNTTELNSNEKSSQRLIKEINYISDIRLLEKVSNYIVSYRINKQTVYFFQNIFNISMSIINLIWWYKFSIKNLLYNSNNVIKINSLNDKKSIINTLKLESIFSQLTISYLSDCIDFLKIENKINKFLSLNDDNMYIIDNLENLLNNIEEITLSKTKTKNLISDNIFTSYINNIYTLICVFIKNSPILYLIFNNQLHFIEKNILENYFIKILMKILSLVEDIKKTNDYYTRSYFILEIKKNIDDLVENINIKNINIIVLVNSYCEFFTTNFNLVLTNFFKQGIFKDFNISLHKEIFNFELAFDFFKNLFTNLKKYLINNSKYYSKLYSFYYILDSTLIVILANEIYKYTLFLDFRGRIYVRDTHQSWVGNTLLRYRIIFNGFIINELLIQKYLTEIDIEFMIILENTFQITINNNKLIYHYLHTYVSAMGCFLDNSQSKKIWFLKGIELINSINLDLKIIQENYSIEDYNKIICYNNNIKEIIKFAKFNDINLTKKLYESTIVVDSVTNGLTQIVGGFKDLKKEELSKALYTSNYNNNSVKEDFYNKILNSIYTYTLDLEELKKDFFKCYYKGSLSKKNLKIISEMENEWKILIEIFNTKKHIILTRSCIKKSVMTVFYGSEFGKWHEITKQHISGLLVLNEYLKLDYPKKDKSRIINQLSWLVASLLKKEFKNLKLTKYTETIKEKLKKINSETLEDIVLMLDNDIISIIYKKSTEYRTIHADSLIKENKNTISFNIPYLEKLDINKISTAFLANLCHTADSYICRRLVERFNILNIPIVTIHDCFIVPVLYLNFLKKEYNSIYYEFYEKYNFIDIIYIKTKNNKYELLFDNAESKDLKENWIHFKDSILNADYNLIFE